MDISLARIFHATPFSQFLAYLGRPVSAGVAVELGWASAMSKPVPLILKQGQDKSQMIEGLSAAHEVRELIIPHGWTDSATIGIANAAILFAKELSAHASTA